MKTMSAKEVHAYCRQIAAIDPDAGDSLTELGLALFRAMIVDDAAQARYLEIYGREWMAPAQLDALASNSNALSTQAGTVVGRR